MDKWNDGMTPEEEELVKGVAVKVDKDLKTISNLTSDKEILVACAWEHLCQNLGIKGYEFS